MQLPKITLKFSVKSDHTKVLWRKLHYGNQRQKWFVASVDQSCITTSSFTMFIAYKYQLWKLTTTDSANGS